MAAGELALLAGGQRIEGTLFAMGSAPATWTSVTMAMNLFTHGVDPEAGLLGHAQDGEIL